MAAKTGEYITAQVRVHDLDLSAVAEAEAQRGG
jgi:hypothetical protein